jgi:hypothetical protein
MRSSLRVRVHQIGVDVLAGVFLGQPESLLKQFDLLIKRFAVVLREKLEFAHHPLTKLITGIASR